MIILASTSPYRRMLLERLQLPFQCIAPNIEERRIVGESVPDMVLRLSREKAAAVADQHPDAYVIGSDQSAEVDGLLLTKPGNYENAFRQLQALSGQTVAFHTGLCIYHQGHHVETLDISLTHFRHLDEALIRHYLEHEQPYNCAGAIKSEGLGALLIQRIECDDPNGLIGLPLLKLIDLLAQLDYPFPWRTPGV